MKIKIKEIQSKPKRELRIKLNQKDLDVLGNGINYVHAICIKDDFRLGVIETDANNDQLNLLIKLIRKISDAVRDLERIG